MANRLTRQFMQQIIGELHRDVQSHFTKRMTGTHAERCNTWIKELFDYTLNDGKCARSLLALNTYQALSPNASVKEFQCAAKTSACIEVLQSFFLVMDDIVDQSELRRGKPCWYRLPGVGLRANIDSLLLESSVDVLMRNALRYHPRQCDILDNLAETKVKTVMGQVLDTATSKISEFNWQLYRELVEHKTSHYTYFFPLLLGFQLADVSVGLSALQNVAYKLGYLFQAQDDYLDVFGEVTVMGKSSNDFAESKCTWLTCALLERIGNDKTKMAEFLCHFGSANPVDIAAVRQLIIKEGITVTFQQFQTVAVQELHSEISDFPVRDIRELLHNSVDAVVDRKK